MAQVLLRHLKQTGTDFRGKKSASWEPAGLPDTGGQVVQEGAGNVCIINRTVSKAEEIAGYINRMLLKRKQPQPVYR